MNSSLFTITSLVLFSVSLFYRIVYFYINKNNNKTAYVTSRQLSLVFDLILTFFLVLISLEADSLILHEVANYVTFGLFGKALSYKINYLFLSIIFSLSCTFSISIRLVMQIAQLHSLVNPISNGEQMKKIKLVIGFLIGIIVITFSIIEAINTFNSFDRTYPYTQHYALFYFNFSVYGLHLIIFLVCVIKLYSNYKRDIPDEKIKTKIVTYLIRYCLYTLIYSITNLPFYYVGFYNNCSIESIYVKLSILLQEAYPIIQFICEYTVIKLILHKNKNFVNTKSIEDYELIKKWKHAEYYIYYNSYSEEFSSLINHEFLCCYLYGLLQIFTNRKADCKTNDKIEIDIIKKSEVFNVQYEINTENFKSDSSLSVSNNTQDLLISNNQTVPGTLIEIYPKVFDSLRKIENVEDKDLAYSFDPEKNADSLRNIKESDGKSGSFFFYSHDKKFIIKTINDTEKSAVNDIFLKEYTIHMNEFYDSSIITKIYGIYTIVLSNKSSINIILMQNLMLFPEDNIYRVFDLKGSRVDRKTKDVKNVPILRALKDLDFMWMNETSGIADFSDDAVERIDSTLEYDLALLRDLNLMDYSFLLIIVKFPSQDDPNYSSIIDLFGDPKYYSKILKSRTSKFIYCFGIIDYLQEFNTKKFLENKYKSVLYGENIKYVSAVDPTNYAERMRTFFKDSVLVKNKLLNN